MRFMKHISILILTAVLASCTQLAVRNPGDGKIWPELGYTPKLPIGMNLPELNPWEPCIAFTDAMTSAGDMVTSVNPQNTGLIDQVSRDADGYPLEIPFKINNQSAYVLFQVNNHYTGRYRIDYKGTGTLGGNAKKVGEKYYIDFDGEGTALEIDILTSDKNDHIRDMHLYPEDIADNPTKPLFLSKFLAGLQSFHAIRFMDWQRTNGSTQVEWADRVTPTYYGQGSGKGVSWDYAIALCNELDADAWVCVPHKASDDYIQKMATLFRDNLESGRKIYLEYSNELWNWGFEQYEWVGVTSAQGAADSYVHTDLAALGGEEAFPQKDAYMMARVFRIWGGVFSGHEDRVVNVATGQAAGSWNGGLILDYLKNTAHSPVEAYAAGGYFSFTIEDHNKWKSKPSSVSAGTMCDTVYDEMEANSNTWARESAALAKSYGLDYLVYEGGQHFVLDTSQEWSYASKEYDAQIHPKMYQLYLRNFDTHVKANVDCKLFMAYDYVSERKSPYGSWGHLESIDDVGKDYSTVAPKYQALIDCNTAK
jgi:hypothetical protein